MCEDICVYVCEEDARVYVCEGGVYVKMYV